MDNTLLQQMAMSKVIKRLLSSTIVSFLCTSLSVTIVSGFVLRNHAFVSVHDNIISQPLTCVDMGNDSLTLAESALNVTGVTLKMAFDTSYAVADASELKSERFTCPQSLDMVHKLRRWSDAVLVGRSTVERDDCTLTVRRVPLLSKSKSQPARVVLDPSLKLIETDHEYAMFKDGHDVFVYHSKKNIDATSLPANVELIYVVTKEDDSLSIIDILHDLKSRNIHHLMVEGGPATAIQFLRQRVVDRAILLRAPVTFIEPVSSGMSNDMFSEAGLEVIKVEACGDDKIEYWSRDGESWPIVDGLENETWPY